MKNVKETLNVFPMPVEMGSVDIDKKDNLVV